MSSAAWTSAALQPALFSLLLGSKDAGARKAAGARPKKNCCRAGLRVEWAMELGGRRHDFAVSLRKCELSGREAVAAGVLVVTRQDFPGNEQTSFRATA